MTLTTPSPISDQAAGDLEAEAINLEQIAKAGERVFSELVVATLRDTALRMREFCAARSTTGSTPEKLPAHEWGGDYPSNDSYQDGYVNGWNDCIDAAPASSAASALTACQYHLCKPKNGGEGFVIDRAPDSFELREYEITALQADRDSVIALVANAITAVGRGGDTYMAAMISADNILALLAASMGGGKS